MGARWYDNSIARWTQPDNVIPGNQGIQALDRYAYTNNNPIRYKDPTGHWIETALDLAFIGYDIYQIQQEGWTLVNTVALVADIACAIVPVGTGGGPAIRAAMVGGDVVGAYSKAAVHLPEAFKVAQGAENLFQFIEGDSGPAGKPDNHGSPKPSDRTVNSIGKPYPEIKDPRTGQSIPAPPDDLVKVPSEQRVKWTKSERSAFIAEWMDKGFPEPPGGWAEYDIHHIIPKEYGGSNDFWNLVPVLRDDHQQLLNPWWMYYDDIY
jgi:hypothetical protein